MKIILLKKLVDNINKIQKYVLLSAINTVAIHTYLCKYISIQ